jgi:hypothetical protein
VAENVLFVAISAVIVVGGAGRLTALAERGESCSSEVK